MLSPGQTLRRCASDRFINAEPAWMDYEGKAIPAVVISFGDVEGPIFDRLLASVDARELVVDLLQSLADQGDSIAIHLLGVLESYQPEPDGNEFDTPEEC